MEELSFLNKYQAKDPTMLDSQCVYNVVTTEKLSPFGIQLLQDIDWVSVEGVRDRVYTLMECVQSMLRTNLK